MWVAMSDLVNAGLELTLIAHLHMINQHLFSLFEPLFLNISDLIVSGHTYDPLTNTQHLFFGFHVFGVLNNYSIYWFLGFINFIEFAFIIVIRVYFTIIKVYLFDCIH